MPVVRIAQTGEKEVRISIPEDQVDALRRVNNIKVRTWARQDTQLDGRLREISPMADPATRYALAGGVLAGTVTLRIIDKGPGGSWPSGSWQQSTCCWVPKA